MKLYYTISEVAQQLNVNPSHLRFLESEFPELKPQTNSRGVRRYTPNDIELLRRMLFLTKECGYTLEGARQQLKEERRQQAHGGSSELENKVQMVQSLKEIRQFLVELKELL